MMNLLKYLIPLIFVLAGMLYSPSRPIKVVTQVYPPYQDGTYKEIYGTTVDVFKCAMSKLKAPYNLTIVDGSEWQTAQDLTSQGKFDMLLGTLHMDSRDKYAVWSQALETNHTYFIKKLSTKINRTDKEAKWGVKNGSGVSGQLGKQENLKIAFKGNDNPDVVKALLENKIDYIYMDINIFKWSLKTNNVSDPLLDKVKGKPQTEFNTTLFNFEPPPDGKGEQLYGAYITKTYITSHPTFLNDFNTSVGICRQESELKN